MGLLSVISGEVIKLTEQKAQENQDFKYIVRIADTDLNGEKSVVHALTGIKGIGFHLSMIIADVAGVNRFEKIGSLPDDKIEKIQEIVSNLNKFAPDWLMNRRKDYYTGKDLHLIGADIDLQRTMTLHYLDIFQDWT